jgi:hypothetical protein
MGMDGAGRAQPEHRENAATTGIDGIHTRRARAY